MNTPTKERRYARVQTELRVNIIPVPNERVAAVSAEIAGGPSVWAPSDESALRDLAAGGATSMEARLGRAVLEMCHRLALLEARIAGHAAEAQPATIQELSGGGGKLESQFPLSDGDCFELRLFSQTNDAPPVRALVTSTGRRDGSSIRYGFRFQCIHPSDHERLIRMIYGIQRRALRNRNS